MLYLFARTTLDPAVELNSETLWYFPRLIESLEELLESFSLEAMTSKPTTEIGRLVGETLDYALAERGLVVIDGLARTGKTTAVEQWIAANPGQARYVQVPSSNDDMSFYRAMCDSLGLCASRNYKAVDLRRRVEETLQAGDLLLCLDEGHYCWPQRNMRKAVPHRINWILTQLVNMGVPVAIITTPQFSKNQETLEKHGGWSSEQLTGRILHYQRLPDSLNEEDLAAVALHWLPQGCADSIEALVKYAHTSQKYLQGIEALAKRARFHASRQGREHPSFLDVSTALKDGVVPSDKALAAALPQHSISRPGRPSAGRLQKPGNISAEPVATPTPVRPFTPPLRDTGEAVLSP